jgi:hypothetical protein
MWPFKTNIYDATVPPIFWPFVAFRLFWPLLAFAAFYDRDFLLLQL